MSTKIVTDVKGAKRPQFKWGFMMFQKVAEYRAVQDKLSAAMPYATQIVVELHSPDSAQHNVVCAVCGQRGAVLKGRNIHGLVFHPCERCRRRGWRLAKIRKRWYQFWRKRYDASDGRLY